MASTSSMEAAALHVRQQDATIAERAAAAAASATGQAHRVPTAHGDIVVTVVGDRAKPAIITFHDVGLNHRTCFQGFQSYPPLARLFSHFCLYHIDAPGHEDGAAELPADFPLLSMQEYAGIVDAVRCYFGVGQFMGLGVGAGAYVMCEYALHFRGHLSGLVIVGPTAHSPSWFEWLSDKLAGWITPNIEQQLLQRWFAPETLRTNPDLVDMYTRELATLPHHNVMHFMKSYAQRTDITFRVHEIATPTLLVCSEQAQHYDGALDLFDKFDGRAASIITVRHCGNLITEENPGVFVTPLHNFLTGALGMIILTEKQEAKEKEMLRRLSGPDAGADKTVGGAATFNTELTAAAAHTSG